MRAEGIYSCGLGLGPNAHFFYQQSPPPTRTHLPFSHLWTTCGEEALHPGCSESAGRGHDGEGATNKRQMAARNGDPTAVSPRRQGAAGREWRGSRTLRAARAGSGERRAGRSYGGGGCGRGPARVAVLAPLPASARASARLPGPPGGAAGAPASRPDASRPGSQRHFDDMFGVSLRVGARGAPGKGRGSPTGSGAAWAGEAEAKGGGRAGPRGAGSGAAGAATRQAWRHGKRGQAALVWSRPGRLGSGQGLAERAAGRGWGWGWGKGRYPPEWLQVSGRATFACLGRCWVSRGAKVMAQPEVGGTHPTPTHPKPGWGSRGVGEPHPLP